MNNVSRRSLLHGGAAAALTTGALPLLLTGGTANAATTSSTIINPIGTGGLPILLWTPQKGWPARPVSTPVIWIDETGSAPKPPLQNGDVLYKAQVVLENTSELLPLPQRALTGGWQLVGGASLQNQQLLLPQVGAGATIDQIPLTPGKRLTFRAEVVSGTATLILACWTGGTQYGNDWKIGGPGLLSCSLAVPAQARVAVVWIKSEQQPAVVARPSLIEGVA